MKNILVSIALVLSLLFIVTGCSGTENVYDIDITRIDLTQKPDNIETELEYLYEFNVVDNSKDYLAHPDSILLNDGRILTLYPAGHGKGAILNSISQDNGITWENQVISTPSSWESSEETPTIYRLNFISDKQKLIMISANPKWPGYWTGDGFNVSLSDDDGASWTQFEKFYGKDSNNHVSPIVAMSSLVRLKENGVFVDKWMGVFHDNKFINYKSILTFDEQDNMNWSIPEPYFSEYRNIEKDTQMCEVLIIRSDNGTGDQLCLLTRSNSKKHNSLISFSDDEGITWSEPREVPSSISGERHKAQYVGDRLFITFRSIERDRSMVKQYRQKISSKWYSEGWVAWVGTYEDLVEGNPGQYRMRLAHTYFDGQTNAELPANADTGYSGVVLLDDGTLIVSSYGSFGEKKADGKGYKTYIVSKRLRLEDIDQLVE